MQIDHRKIGHSQPPFIIAEMSGNHNQSLERALEIVKAAAKAGVQALKIQTYTADTMTIDLDEREFHINSPNSLWKGQSLYKLYEKAHTPWEWHKPIFDLGRKLGLIVFSTPFDVTAVDYLEDLNIPCYKISSFENTDLQLIKKVASTKKPLFISTGMATSDELNETVHTIREAGCNDFVLLKCTSAYPANPLQSNLLTIPDLRKRFGCIVGISDHTLGIGASIASLAIGGSVIEKHFTLRRNDGGVDSQFSMEPMEMENLVNEAKNAWNALGKVSYGPTDAEKESIQFRRSLYIVKNIKAGDVLTENNVRAIRPGLGVSTKYLESILGKTINQNVNRGTAFSLDMID